VGKRTLLAAIVGGFVMFAWSALAHMVLPLGEMGLSSIPAQAESAVLEGLRANLPGPGLYFYPGMTGQDAAAMAAWTEKVETGPSGLLLYHPSGGAVMGASTLLGEIGSDVLAALIAAIVLANVAFEGLVPRAGLTALLGLFAWASISLSTLIWYRYPAPFVVAEGVEQVVGWFLAGLAMARLVRPATGLAS